MRRVNNLVPNNFQILAAQPMQNESRIEKKYSISTQNVTPLSEVPNSLEAE